MNELLSERIIFSTFDGTFPNRKESLGILPEGMENILSAEQNSRIEYVIMHFYGLAPVIDNINIMAQGNQICLQCKSLHYRTKVLSSMKCYYSDSHTLI